MGKIFFSHAILFSMHFIYAIMLAGDSFVKQRETSSEVVHRAAGNTHVFWKSFSGKTPECHTCSLCSSISQLHPV